MIDWRLLHETAVSVFTGLDIWLFLGMMGFFILLCAGEKTGGEGQR